MNTIELHLNTYHQDPYLLFQFILSEFFTLHLSVHAISQQSINKRTITKINGTLKQLIDEASEPNMFHWQGQSSCVSKLHKYCYNLPNMSITEITDLQVILRRPPFNADDIQAMKMHISEIEQKIRLLAEQIEKIMPQFINNENVLFFLLKHQQTVAKLYGPNFLLDLFSKAFRGRKKEVSKFLEKKYTERGFEILLPIIQKKLQELNA